MSENNYVATVLPPFVVRAFPPSQGALLAAVARPISDDMLVEISKADYCSNWDQHLAQLRPIRDSLSLASSMAFYPAEVLRLVRWSRATHEREHAMRAFCCAALLGAAALPGNAAFRTGENETLAQMIESALFLQRGVPEVTASFVIWRIETQSVHRGERPFFAFGLLALLLLSAPAMFVPQSEELAAFVEHFEAREGGQEGAGLTEVSRDSFLESTFHRQRHGVWRSLAARLSPLVPASSRAEALMRRIGAKE
jgi:hypothetical protein